MIWCSIACHHLDLIVLAKMGLLTIVQTSLREQRAPTLISILASLL